MNQARLVTGWLTSSSSIFERARREGIFIRNGSEQPIYDVTISTRDVDDRVGNWAVGVVPPGTTIDRPRRTDGQKPMPDTSVPIAFWFKDAAGLRWFRDWDGELREWPSDGSPDWWERILAEQHMYEVEQFPRSGAP